MLALLYLVPTWHDADVRFYEWMTRDQAPEISDRLAVVYLDLQQDDVAVGRRTLAAFLDRLIAKRRHPEGVVFDFDFGPCSSRECGKAESDATMLFARSLDRAKSAAINVYGVDRLSLERGSGSVVGPIAPENPQIYSRLAGSGYTTVQWKDRRFIFYRACYQVGEGGFLQRDVWAIPVLVQREHVPGATCTTDERVLHLGVPLGRGDPAVMKITDVAPFPSGADLKGKYVLVGWGGQENPDTDPRADRPNPEILAWAIDGESKSLSQPKALNAMLRFASPLFSLLTVVAFGAFFLMFKRLKLRGVRTFLPDLCALLALGSGLALLSAFEWWMASSVGAQPQVTVLTCGILCAGVLCDVRGRQILFQERWGIERQHEDACDYDVFISYAHEERAWVDQNILRPLEDVRLPSGRPLAIFIDKESIRVGDAWKDKFCDAIDNSRFVIPVYTATYIEKPYCVFELHRAHEKWIKAGRDSNCVLPIMRGHPPILPQVRDFQYRSIDDDDGRKPGLVAEIISRIVETISRTASVADKSAARHDSP